MKDEKHREAINEVMETIGNALEDKRPGGILLHQRRLTSMISFGSAQLVEMHLHKLKVIKPGASVKHDWFGQDERKIKLRLSPLLTTAIEKIPGINDVVFMAHEIEKDRNVLFYGSPIPHDKILREKIDLFLELKKLAGE